jgi:NAD(P)-dependent dehydrogenase (short-subunit alcohol dehydrogenase family)
MRPSTALVTGGTDGVGKEIGLGLARAGVQVLVVGRISAGIVRGRHVLTAEGVESNFATNYLGRVVFSVGLLPLLETSGSPDHRSRTLLISGAATNRHVHFDDVNLTRRFGTLRAVLQFCQANDLFTVEFAHRLARAGERRVTITCLKLGVVQTNIRREFPAWMKWLVPLVLDPLIGLSAREAAGVALRLLDDPEFENTSGPLFQLIKTFKPSAVPMSVRDPDARTRLWALSEQLAARGSPGHVEPSEDRLLEVEGRGNLAITSRPVRASRISVQQFVDDDYSDADRQGEEVDRHGFADEVFLKAVVARRHYTQGDKYRHHAEDKGRPSSSIHRDRHYHNAFI